LHDTRCFVMRYGLNEMPKDELKREFLVLSDFQILMTKMC
jgi:hypothetical protein